MRKIIRWSFLLGLVFCLIGTGMITTGVLMGGGRYLIQEKFFDEVGDWELEWHYENPEKHHREPDWNHAGESV